MSLFSRRPWLLPLGLLILAGGWLLFSYGEYRRLLAQEQELRAQIEQLRLAAATPAERARPLEPDRLPELYRVILHRAEEAGIEVLELSPGESDLNLVTTGSFAGVYHFLVLLARLDFPIWIDRYRITPEDPEARRIRLELRLGVRLGP